MDWSKADNNQSVWSNKSFVMMIESPASAILMLVPKDERVEPVAILPKFSIQQLLMFMIVVGGVSACLAGAARGNPVAFGLSVGIGGLILPAMVFAAAYWVLYACAVATQAVVPAETPVGIRVAEEIGTRRPNAESGPAEIPLTGAATTVDEAEPAEPEGEL